MVDRTSPAVDGDAESFDYIVIGSGAGGGPLAANLAKHGFRVLLLEAGSDCGAGLTYEVPGFHGLASEDPTMTWEFFVHHYDDPVRRAADSKYRSNQGTWQREGVLYPRAGTLGGCTAHNAMITIVPHEQDWDEIAKATGDDSWRSKKMRPYFERLECCTYAALPGFWGKLASVIRRLLWLRHDNLGRHGFKGWLTTSKADVRLGLKDPQLVEIVLKAVRTALWSGLLSRLQFWRVREDFDPNDWDRAKKMPEGVVFTPLATKAGKRTGPRDYILATRAEHPDRLFVQMNCLATRILIDGQKRATGVEYLAGPHLYRADPSAAAEGNATRRVAHASREVILSAGAFNSPQLLKLSGIGPKEELKRLGIDVIVDLPGVGENLQDRYEVGVIYEMQNAFRILDGASYQPPAEGAPAEQVFLDWQEGRGPYTSNGSVIGIIKRSRRRLPNPDLIIFGLPGYFEGYYPGYSKKLIRNKHFFTWAILKAHTRNTAGRVLLRSADPRDEPIVSFRYFDEGNDTKGDDVRAVVSGVKFVRGIMEHIGWDNIQREVIPGPKVKTDAELTEFVKREAWGHHASCSNKMGPRSDPMAVVDSRFRVHGITGLRVVDASVFPRIPGFFIVTAIYMLSEKATDALLADAATHV